MDGANEQDCKDCWQVFSCHGSFKLFPPLRLQSRNRLAFYRALSSGSLHPENRSSRTATSICREEFRAKSAKNAKEKNDPAFETIAAIAR